MFSHLPVVIQCLFKMTADMHQVVEQPHVGVGPEGCLTAYKTVALKITLEVILISSTTSLNLPLKGYPYQE